MVYNRLVSDFIINIVFAVYIRLLSDFIILFENLYLLKNFGSSVVDKLFEAATHLPLVLCLYQRFK